MTERCSKNSIDVTSDSNAEKKYTVSFENVLPTCNCTAYAIGKNVHEIMITEQ